MKKMYLGTVINSYQFNRNINTVYLKYKSVKTHIYKGVYKYKYKV